MVTPSPNPVRHLRKSWTWLLGRSVADLVRFFPRPLRKDSFPLIVSQLLCQVRPVASIVANYCRLGDHQLWCILLLHGFAARVWVSRKNAAKFPCSKAKFPVTFSCSFCCKEFGQENHVRSIGSQPHPENKMLEELYGLAPEPGVWRGNVDRCHSRQEFWFCWFVARRSLKRPLRSLTLWSAISLV